MDLRSECQTYLEDKSTELREYSPEEDYLTWYESFTEPLPTEAYYELQLDQDEEYCWANRPVYFPKGTQYA